MISKDLLKKLLPFLVLFFTVVVFFKPFIVNGKIPIPSDALIGLYNPFRDFYVKDYPQGAPYKNFLITDPIRQQYPWRWLSFALERQNELPLWNPYTMSGAPLLATMQPAAFYPLNILFFLLPFSLAWGMLIFLEQVLAGFFCYLYLNNVRLQRVASLFGALVFSFSGFFIMWLEWGTLIHVALWLPLILLSVDKLFFDKQYQNNAKFKVKNYYIWFLIFVFSLTAAFFAGHLQIFFYLFLVVLTYFILRWIYSGKDINSFLFFILLIIIFLLLTVVQWLPTLQFINESARNLDQDLYWQKDGWFIPWQHLIQFIAPDFFGNPTTLNYWGVWNYGELVGYIGVLPLFMAIFALLYRHDRKTLFFGCLFFLSLVFSLPTIFAKLPYILQIPLLSTSQPTRLLFLTDFSLAMLAAFGLDSFLKNHKKKQILYIVGGVGMVFLLLWIVVFVGSKILPSVTPENLAIAKHNLYIPTFLFLFGGGLVIYFTRNKNKKVQTVLLIAIIALTILDLLRFAQKFTPFTDKAYLFPTTTAIAYLQKQPGQFRIMTTDDRILPPNVSIMYHLQTIDGYDPLYLRRYAELISAMNRDAPDLHPPFGFNRIITSHRIDSRLIDLLGVKYILSLSDLQAIGLKRVFSEGQTRIYQNTQVYPRAFFVTNIQPVATKEKAIEGLFDSNNNLRNVAIVEGWDNKGKVNGDKSPGLATISTYKENSVQIKTSSQRTGFLVLVDTFYPTWEAKICSSTGDHCQKTNIYRTDFNFRGVVVPAGKHTIVFSNSLL